MAPISHESRGPGPGPGLGSGAEERDRGTRGRDTPKERGTLTRRQGLPTVGIDGGTGCAVGAQDAPKTTNGFVMIVVTRLNGSRFAVNPDLVERVQASPDTTLVLVGGTTYIVQETLDEVIDLIAAYRARVISTAYAGPLAEHAAAASSRPHPHAHAGARSGGAEVVALPLPGER
jgi:flagellar protein FlbD